MEEQNQSNSLEKVKNRSLSNFVKTSIPKAYDLGRKALRIAGAGAAGFAGAAAAVIGGPVIAPIGTAVAIYSLARAGMNVIYKTEPSLMFVSKLDPLSGERKIFQDTRLDLASHMRGYNNYEKAGMMALQSLVGFSRYKTNLEGTDYTPREDGSKVYTQKYSTVTHTINLKTFEALEKLGLIEIESMDESFKNTGKIADALGMQPKGKKGYLISEKIGFKNFDSLRDLAKAALAGDKETLEKSKVTFKKVNFRLTDKPIDFEDLFLKYNKARPYESKEERDALKTFGLVFDRRRGVLGNKNIDIGKDVLGRSIISYGRKVGFGERLQTELEVGRATLNQKDEKSNDRFLENTNSRVDKETLKGLEEVAMESRKKQETQKTSEPNKDQIAIEEK